LGSCFVESSENNKLDGKMDFFSPLLIMKGLLKVNYCWMGRESWHAIKKLFNLPFLTLKVRHLICQGGSILD